MVWPSSGFTIVTRRDGAAAGRPQDVSQYHGRRILANEDDVDEEERRCVEAEPVRFWRVLPVRRGLAAPMMMRSRLRGCVRASVSTSGEYEY